MNYELESIWKEAVVVQFEVLSRHLSGEAKKNYKSSYIRVSGHRTDIWTSEP